MSRHTAVFEFAGAMHPLDRSIVPDTGTSVTVEYYNGVDWTVDSDSPVTTPSTVFTSNTRIRLTPDTGGFYLDDADVT